MTGSTVAAGVTSRVVAFAAGRGADAAALRDAAGISAAALEDHDARIPLELHIALLRAAKTMTGDRAFALHYGEAVNLAEVSVVGLIGYASETLLEAFAQLRRYSRIIVDLDCGEGERFELCVEDGAYWIVDHRARPELHPELTEVAFAQMASGTRRFGDSDFVKEVRVTHADPGYGDEYGRVFGAPVAFGCERNAMRINAAWLNRSARVQPPYVFGVLTRHADALLEKLDRDVTMRARVERAILPRLHTGATTMQQVARELGYSRDTLYRKLAAEGVTFARILDDLRRRQALEYLAADRVSLNEIAYLVGFSDPAAFSRAFRRWTGDAPGKFRARSRAGARS